MIFLLQGGKENRVVVAGCNGVDAAGRAVQKIRHRGLANGSVHGYNKIRLESPGGESRGLFHAFDSRRLVDKPETEKELEALRRSVNRGTPFGDVSWTRRTADRLDLQFTLRPVGRTRKKGRN